MNFEVVKLILASIKKFFLAGAIFYGNSSVSKVIIQKKEKRAFEKISP